MTMHRHPSPRNVPHGLLRGLTLCVGALCVGALCVGLLSGCGAGEAPGEGYEVLGFVVEARGTGTDGPRIGGATLHFETDTGRTVEGVSQGDGRYRLFIVSDTRFGYLRANAPGYLEARETVYFDSPSRRLDLVLPRDGALGD